MLPSYLIVAILAEEFFYYTHSSTKDLGLYGLYRRQIYMGVCTRMVCLLKRVCHWTTGIYIAVAWRPSLQPVTPEPCLPQEHEELVCQEPLNDGEPGYQPSSNADAGQQASLFPPPYPVCL